MDFLNRKQAGGFFCCEELREQLKGYNLSTQKLDKAIDFEMFRSEPEMALNHRSSSVKGARLTGRLSGHFASG